MTARDDLLQAAKQLTERGIATFSPIELIEEARRLGSNYPDNTLRTHIVGVMTANSPDHWGVTDHDFVRVGRGLYRLITPGDAGSPVLARTPSPPKGSRRSVPAADPEPAATGRESWSWEGNVQSLVVAALSARAWRIRRVADTHSREHGVDIEADQDGIRLLVEVKGYPSTSYLSGDKEGEQKSPAGLGAQARVHFASALLSGHLLRAEKPDARVALAFPAMPTYLNLVERLRDSLNAAGIELWTITENGGLSGLP
jgi:hypothetical protein